MTKFDILIENILNITEGRKPKQYNKMVIDFDKLENDILSLSDQNPFKKIYKHAIDGLKQYSDNEYFTNEEMSSEAKTLPEWEDAIFNAFSGQSLSNIEKKRFTERFFNFLKDPDREYFSEFIGNEKIKNFESMEQHIYDYINGSDDEKATLSDVVAYINRYGHDENEVKDVIEKMVKDGQLEKIDNNTLRTLKDPSLDSNEPDDSELSDNLESDDMEAFRDDTLEDETPDEKLPDDISRELGIDPNDPFGDDDFFDSNR